MHNFAELPHVVFFSLVHLRLNLYVFVFCQDLTIVNYACLFPSKACV